MQTLDGHGGDAVMAGLLDVCEGLIDEARDMLIELGCDWCGPVRLQALQLLAARDPDRAVALAEKDPSATVRRRALSLRRGAAGSSSFTDQGSGAAAAPANSASDTAPPSNQLALFG